MCVYIYIYIYIYKAFRLAVDPALRALAAAEEDVLWETNDLNNSSNKYSSRYFLVE